MTQEAIHLKPRCKMRNVISIFVLFIFILTLLLHSSCGVLRKTSYDKETKVVDVLNPVTGRIWMDRNLGASRVATSIDDEEAFGDLYQWGRAADGHQRRNSKSTVKLSSTNTPKHRRFIRVTDRPFDWRTVQEDNLWQGVNGVNNPCPPGYRLPTEAEWVQEISSWTVNSASGAFFGSPLKLTSAGYRHNNHGTLFTVGSEGYYWSSTVVSYGARSVILTSTSAGMHPFGRISGFSVRCIKD